MDLVLWRHAQAVDAADEGDDMARRLTSRGQRQARAIAAWLDEQLPQDARVMASPARRTVETAQALSRPHEIAERLAPHLGTVEALLSVVDVPMRLAPDAGLSDATVVVVGHQPVLGMAAALLLSGQAQPWHVKKGAVWWLRSRPHGGWDLWMVRPPQV